MMKALAIAVLAVVTAFVVSAAPVFGQSATPTPAPTTTPAAPSTGFGF